MTTMFPTDAVSIGSFPGRNGTTGLPSFASLTLTLLALTSLSPPSKIRRKPPCARVLLDGSKYTRGGSSLQSTDCLCSWPSRSGFWRLKRHCGSMKPARIGTFPGVSGRSGQDPSNSTPSQLITACCGSRTQSLAGWKSMACFASGVRGDRILFEPSLIRKRIDGCR